MKYIYFLIFTWFSLSGIAQNLLNNGDFENFTGSTPDGWTTIDSGITTDQETTTVYEGSKSLKITVTTDNQENTDIKQTISIENGAIYDVTIYFQHVAGDNDVIARLNIGGLGSIYSSPSVVNSWGGILAGFTATADEDIEVGLRFYDLSTFDGSSVVYVDNFKIIKRILSVEESEFVTFSVHPNPVSNGFVNITSTTNEAISAQVFNLLGKQVMHQTINNNTLNVASLYSGIYILKLTQNGNSTTKKLVIK
ncbi:MAG: T9SS type A sorting domain-containing protein [Oceanihabitans sp.]|nr:T9SS type A sorting domain-containing protein [Oceanihabitans sp.]